MYGLILCSTVECGRIKVSFPYLKKVKVNSDIFVSCFYLVISVNNPIYIWVCILHIYVYVIMVWNHHIKLHNQTKHRKKNIFHCFQNVIMQMSFWIFIYPFIFVQGFSWELHTRVLYSNPFRPCLSAFQCLPPLLPLKSWPLPLQLLVLYMYEYRYMLSIHLYVYTWVYIYTYLYI